MAETSPITRNRVSEVLPLVQTRITALFSQLLAATTAHIVAERRIEALDLSDPAHERWLHDAEEAQTAMAGLLGDLQRTAPVSALDMPLVRMSRLLDAMTGAEERGRFMHLHARLPDYAEFLRVPGSGAEARAVASLIVRAQRCIAFMAELSLYQHDAPDHPLGVDSSALDANDSFGMAGAA